MKQVLLCVALGMSLVPGSSIAWEAEALRQVKDSGRCEGCDLSGADLRWAAVYGAELGGAPNLMYGMLDGANLAGANLYGANLESVSLKGASLVRANLSWASLTGADLTGADFTGANMIGAVTTGATFCGTLMPEGIRNDAHC